MRKFVYVKYNVHRILSIRQLVTVHYIQHAARFCTEPERHDFWEIVFVDYGRVEVTTDTSSFVLGSGEMCFHDPNQEHSLKIAGEQSTVFIVSFVCKSPAASLFANQMVRLNDEQLHLLSMMIHELKGAFLHSSDQPLLLRDIQHFPNSPIGAEEMAINYLEQLLITILRGITRARDDEAPVIHTSKSEMDNHIVADIRQYIDEHLSEHISIPDLARDIRYSKAYITRIFKQVTGQSIMEYLNHRRIETAKKLLLRGNMTITAISETLGYSSVHYFSHRFKTTVGCSPLQYAKTMEIKLSELER